jgi:hypothetical protein
MVSRLEDIGIWVIKNVALWVFMVISYYAIKTLGMWNGLVGAIILGIVEGAFPHFRKWIYR